MTTCTQCGSEKPHEQVKLGVCDECFKFGPPKKSGDDAPRQHEQELGRRMKELILTTSVDVPNRHVDKVLSIVGAEAALGINVLRDIANNWRDLVGGRSATSQNSLKEARLACLEDLRREAAMAGAHAVIAVDLDYSELSTHGSGGGILFVAATGTAVTLKP